MIRRLVAGLLVFGLVLVFAAPTSAQKKEEKKEEKKKEEAKKEEKKEEKKGEEKKEVGEAVSMHWKFVKDRAFYQKMTTKTDQTMKIMGNDVKQVQNQIFYFSWKPTSDDKDGRVTLEQEIIGVQMDIEIGGSKISYDSVKDAAANNPLGDFFKALVGSKFIVTLNTRTLKVENVEGRDEFVKKLVAANPQMRQLLDTILSKDALKEMSEPTFAVIPTEATAKGKTWTRDTNLDMGPIGKYRNNYKYTYEGPEGAGDKQVQKIKCETNLTYEQPNDAGGQGGLPFKIKSAALKSTNPTGEIRFNNSSGRLESAKTVLKLDGKLAIEIGGQTTDVTLAQEQTSTIETMDANPLPTKK